MKRMIIDYKKISPELAGLLLEKYPQGYGDDDIISFKNARGEWVEAVELQTADTLYLVKIGTNLSYLLSHFEDLEAEGEPEERQISAVGELEGEYDGSLESELDLDD
ncbi:MAG TPA: hypothetical protein VLL47_12015 [Robiginitalea sp.]|nr:hypothetical protein [Robiginitalea sp.]